MEKEKRERQREIKVEPGSRLLAVQRKTCGPGQARLVLPRKKRLSYHIRGFQTYTEATGAGKIRGVTLK